MKALLLDRPCCSTVPADTKPNRGRGDHDVGINWMRTNFVHITVDVDSGFPSHTAVRRPRYATDVNVGKEHGPVRGCGYRANPERRSDELAVYERRARVPFVTPRHGVEAAELVDLAICADAQDACIVGPDVDDVADCHGAREWKLTGSDRTPLALKRAPAKRVSVDDSESAAVPVSRKSSDRLTGELVVTGLASDDEQPIAPRSEKSSELSCTA